MKRWMAVALLLSALAGLRAAAQTTVTAAGPVLPPPADYVALNGFEGNPTSVTLDENVVYFIQMSWRGAADRFQLDGGASPQLMELENLRLVRQMPVVTERVSDDRMSVTYRYLLKPETVGTASVGRIYFNVQDTATRIPQPRELEKCELQVKAVVQPVAVEKTPLPDPPKAEKSPSSGVLSHLWNPDIRWQRYALWGGIAVVVLLAAVALLAQFGGGKASFEVDEHNGAPFERFEAELVVLQRKINEREYLDLYVKSRDWFRKLAAAAINEPALRRGTSADVKQRLQSSKLPADFVEQLLSLLETADHCIATKNFPPYEEQMAFYKDCRALIRVANDLVKIASTEESPG
ncbi:hypothetical protein JXA32_15705 [Candidatus Sumerlaeota bacterium]|nr:hypothetical protein [Candidatus Sumerlaeota bacterium]